MIPVVFSAFAMQSVGSAAMDMVQEVRRQFREIPGLLEGTGKADYARCVEISTKAALREMLPPGLITIVTPVLVGFIMGPEALGGYMAGVTVSGVMWAIFQSNAGGAWDNAKKSFEKGVEINGQMYYKGSEPHKAAVTGDTVGDPFKDTSGPSMNILIKLTCLVGLTIAPILGGHSGGNQTSGMQLRERTNRVEAEGPTYNNLGNGSNLGVIKSADSPQPQKMLTEKPDAVAEPRNPAATQAPDTRVMTAEKKAEMKKAMKAGQLTGEGRVDQ
jgi:K(+)-stimulated pyrophosphate-energized sodium pump